MKDPTYDYSVDNGSLYSKDQLFDIISGHAGTRVPPGLGQGGVRLSPGWSRLSKGSICLAKLLNYYKGSGDFCVSEIIHGI